MRTVTLIMLAVFITLQVRLWAGDGSLAEVWRLERAIERQSAENAALQARNVRLAAEVQDLKSGLSAVEARARHELGLIGPDETFFLVVD